MVAEGAGITLCAAFSSRLINQSTEAYFFFFVATELEDGEIGEEFEPVGVTGGFQMLENSPLYEYNLLRKLRGCLARAVCKFKMRFGPKMHVQPMVVFGSLLVENAFCKTRFAKRILGNCKLV